MTIIAEAGVTIYDDREPLNPHDIPLNLGVAVEAFAVVRSETGVIAVPTNPVVRT